MVLLLGLRRGGCVGSAMWVDRRRPFEVGNGAIRSKVSRCCITAGFGGVGGVDDVIGGVEKGVTSIGAELSSPVGISLSARRLRIAALTMQYGSGLLRMSLRRLYHCRSWRSEMRIRWLLPRVMTECV